MGDGEVKYSNENQKGTENDWFFIFTVKYSINAEKNCIQMQNNLISIYLKIRYCEIYMYTKVSSNIDFYNDFNLV